MKTAYVGLATVAMLILTLTTFARADAQGGWTMPLQGIEAERPLTLDELADDPLGLLWEDDGTVFDEEIIIRDGVIYT